MAGDCIFRASGGPNFENCSTHCHGTFMVRCMYLHAQITSGYNTEMIIKVKATGHLTKIIQVRSVTVPVISTPNGTVERKKTPIHTTHAY